jgi:hypothetical protein
MVLRLQPQPAKGGKRSEALQEIMQIDAARIIRRKLQLSSRSDANEKNEVDEVDAFKYLLGLIGVQKDKNNAFKVIKEQRVDLQQFINALIVAQVFAETTQEQSEKGTANE